MNDFDDTSSLPHYPVANTEGEDQPKAQTLRSEVERALSRYFSHLEGAPVTDLHQMVMAEVEEPLLQAVMSYTGNNQSKASIMLGLNRGTLRTKLKHYGLL